MFAAENNSTVNYGKLCIITGVVRKLYRVDLAGIPSDIKWCLGL